MFYYYYYYLGYTISLNYKKGKAYYNVILV